MSKIILMLGHQSKVGKDTLADQLVEHAGFKKIAFADKLKEVCSDLFNIPLQEFYDEKLKNEIVEQHGMTRRRILQIVGQAMFEVDKLVWVKHALKKFENLDRIVLTDFRFIHEIGKIQEFAAENGYTVITVKLTREGIPEFTGKEDRSELELINYQWEFRIQNNGTIDELTEKGIAIVNFMDQNSESLKNCILDSKAEIV